MAGVASLLNRAINTTLRRTSSSAHRIMDEVASSAARTRHTLTGVNRGIDEALAGVPSNMTVGSNVMKGLAWGGASILTNKVISSYEDEFGHRMSEGAKFTLGAVKNIGALAMGGRAVTHFGRAGILKYNQVATNSAGNRSVRSMGRRLDNLDIDTDRYGAQLDKVKGWATGTNRPRPAPSGTRFRTNRRRLQPVAHRARRKVVQTDRVRQSANETLRRFNNNKDEIAASFGKKSAAGFSTSGMVGGAFRFAGNFIGGSLGKGSLWGKTEEGAALVGGAMGLGMIGGMMGGTLAGIASISRGNLRATGSSAPMGNRGRSFSNISYNATLHSHRMGM